MEQMLRNIFAGSLNPHPGGYSGSRYDLHVPFVCLLRSTAHVSAGIPSCTKLLLATTTRTTNEVSPNTTGACRKKCHAFRSPHPACRYVSDKNVYAKDFGKKKGALPLWRARCDFAVLSWKNMT